MKYPHEGLEVLGKCIFTNGYEDAYEKWLVVFFNNGKWRDTIEGEEREVVFWRDIEEPIETCREEKIEKKPVNKIWGKENLRQFQDMINLGKRHREIAEFFGVSLTSVRSTVRRYKITRDYHKEIHEKFI